MKKKLYIKQTVSTNALAWEMNHETELAEGSLIYTDFQTNGKGQPGNTWESEDSRNLLFSIVLHPHQVPMDELFLISELVSISIKKALDLYVSDITVKWPNDIYWKDKKLAGILIENSLQGSKIKTVVIGIGLNVNQKEFKSNAPNPVSLIQITQKRNNRQQLLQQICGNILEMYTTFDNEYIQSEYACSLFRRNGFHLFRANGIDFKAKIAEVCPDGQLLLEKDDGERVGFYFKEVQFIL